jgi:hypothetical protein
MWKCFLGNSYLHFFLEIWNLITCFFNTLEFALLGNFEGSLCSFVFLRIPKLPI